MATFNGQITICDRQGCNEKIFRKCTGEGELDGGYTRWNKFEEFPDGWEFHTGIGMLCPKCNAEYHKMVEIFKQNAREQNGQM